jgi:hypothetical protein
MHICWYEKLDRKNDDIYWYSLILCGTSSTAVFSQIWTCLQRHKIHFSMLSMLLYKMATIVLADCEVRLSTHGCTVTWTGRASKYMLLVLFFLSCIVSTVVKWTTASSSFIYAKEWLVGKNGEHSNMTHNKPNKCTIFEAGKKSFFVLFYSRQKQNINVKKLSLLYEKNSTGFFFPFCIMKTNICLKKETKKMSSIIIKNPLCVALYNHRYISKRLSKNNFLT